MKCPACSEDELEGGKCLYCGYEPTTADWQRWGREYDVPCRECKMPAASHPNTECGTYDPEPR